MAVRTTERPSAPARRDPISPAGDGPVQRGLPDGPRLPPVLQGTLLFKYPVPFLRGCLDRYGRCFTLTAPPLGRTVYVWQPRDVHTIFRGDPEVFRVRQVRKAHALVMGPNSLLLQDGEQHLRDRRLLSPHFHGQHLQQIRELVDEVVERDLERWPIGRPFAVRPYLHEITLEIIIRIVLGEELYRSIGARLRQGLADLVKINPALMLTVTALRRDLGPWSPWGRFVRVRRAVNELVDDAMRRARATDGDDGGVLSGLVRTGLSDEEIHDELMTLLLAGEETTASALAWAFERLTHNPAVLGELVRSIDAGEDGYLQAVITETLRSRPLVAVTPRWLGSETEIAGRSLPAGTVVCISQLLAHANPERYPEPERFVPERFLESDPDPAAFLPFGGGARRCLGAALAQLEMTTVLRAALSRFRVRAARPRSERITMHHVTFSPSRGAEVVLELRRPQGANRR